MEYSEYVDELDFVPACHTCGCEIEDGQPWFLLQAVRRLADSTLAQDDWESAKNLRQTCTDCMKKGPVEALRVQGVAATPVHLFVDSLSTDWPPLQVLWQDVVGNRVACSSCDSVIERGCYYVTIELVRAIQKGTAFEEALLFSSKLLCDGCATKQGMVVGYDDSLMSGTTERL